MRLLRFTVPVALVIATLAGDALYAVNVRHMNLRELVTRADRIVRGTVIAQDDTTVSAGGGQLPATLYRIQVAETLKGSAANGEVIEVRLLARPKNTGTAMRRGTILQDLPEFRVGQEYLFVLTRPSAAGLSTTVGLRQGLFELRGRGDDALAVNGANNAGLLEEPAAAATARSDRRARPRAAGPISYATLADEIRGLVRR